MTRAGYPKRKLCRGCMKRRDFVLPLERYRYLLCPKCQEKIKAAIRDGITCKHGRKADACQTRECTVAYVMRM